MGVGALSMTMPGCSGLAKRFSAKKEPPNIVFIMADDMGYGDVGCYGAKKIQTPNIDQLAEQGMRLVNAHTPSAVCSPTRYGVLTGRYCWRSRLKSWVLGSGYAPLLIEPQRMTVASMLRQRGYTTGAVGKWHLGFGTEKEADYGKRLEPGPLSVGFDYSFAFPASNDMAPYCYIENGYVVGELTEDKHPRNHQQREGLMTEGFRDEEVGPTLTRKAVAFIEESARGEAPFFLYFTPVAPHRPNVVAEFMKGKSQAGERGDHVQEFDWSVGEVLKSLERLGLRENTLVIVTSDNGARLGGRDGTFGHQSCGDLRGQKADVWDGGHTVPFVARWPGRIQPGSTSDELICLTDLMATSAAIADATLPRDAGEDSYNVLPALLHDTGGRPIREAVVHHSGAGMFAIRQGDWKLVLGRGSGGFSEPKSIDPDPGEPTGQLYNLSVDPAETNNLWAEHPGIVDRLTALLTKYQSSGRSRP